MKNARLSRLAHIAKVTAVAAACLLANARVAEAQQITLGANYRQGYSSPGLTNTTTTNYSFSLQLGLGAYVRIGVTTDRSLSDEKGYKVGECPTGDSNCRTNDDGSLTKIQTYEEKIRAVANSLDLTLVLYGGEVFVPYVIGGAVMKTYYVSDTLDGETAVQPPQTILGPNGGVGLNIQLHRDLSLNLRYMVSYTGITRDPYDPLNTKKNKTGTPEPAATVGVEYKINI